MTPLDAIHPQTFSTAHPNLYLRDPLATKLVEFFEAKGLIALKEEDRAENWYADWIAHQTKHQLYARLLAPRQFSSLNEKFNLLRYTRFLEIFGYFSPAHGYSLQVTFLGLFAILMGTNDSLKREAIGALEAGGLFAFGVSEKEHGSDLLTNEFSVRPIDGGRFVANGSKYYIGNANAAAMIAILARKESERANSASRRAPIVLFALHPSQSTGFGPVRKIRTLGVRAAFVGEFEVTNHELPESDLFAQGRDAWDALFGTITLGKFFLGFGSIGICERAFAEATAHLQTRILYGKPVIDMPHIRALAAQAWARLTAMKLYAYRALDYVHAASESDRRYLLYCAVQKARVSTEGVKVVSLLSECIGAKGFESDTWFEMALRDIQLIPGLEGSTHINLTQAAQFLPRYFAAPPHDAIASPPSQIAGETAPGENPYLVQARTGAINTIAFADPLAPYRSLRDHSNVRRFARQVIAFRRLLRHRTAPQADAAGDTQTAIALGHCMATIAYAQLVAENALRLGVPPQLISVIFHGLVNDLSAAALSLAALPNVGSTLRNLLRKVVAVPRTPAADWEFIARRIVDAPSPV
jgi:acyl-CoA dehydrogenase